MTIEDREIYEQSYALFCDEAPELLHKVEQGLLDLGEGSSRELLHELMRATHTLKGASANVGLDDIKAVAHHMEDVFRALMSPDAEADDEIQRLLFESYECLRLALNSRLQQGRALEHSVSERSAQIFEHLKERLHYCWDYDPVQLTSADLGIDLAKSIFEVGVQQRLSQLAATLTLGGDPEQMAIALREQLEVFVGLAESLNLPGFRAIADTATTAIARNPQQSPEIGQIALENLQEGREIVLAGDRERGGEPSPALLAIASGNGTPAAAAIDSTDNIGSSELEAAFGGFAASDPETDTEFAGDLELEATFGDFSMPSGPADAPEDAIPSLDNAPARADETLGATDASPETAPEESDLDLDAAFGAFGAPAEEFAPAAADAAAARALDEAFGSFEAPSPVVETAAKTSATPESAAIEDESAAAAAQPPSAPSLSPPAGRRVPLPPPAVPVPSAAFPEPPPTHAPDLEAQEIRQQQQSLEKALPRSRGKTPVRVDLEHLEHLSHLVNELAIEQNQLSLREERFYGAVSKLDEWLKTHRHTLARLHDELPYAIRSQLPETYYAALEEVSQLEQAAGDVQMLSRTTAANVERERRLSRQLQDSLEEARMVPVEKVFSRFPPMIERLGRSYGKDVRLQLQGLQVPIDKTIAEGLYDALLHLARNAFDHGIEPVAVRQQRGKPAAGTITLRAYIQGNRTILEVSDDGGGLDTEKICQRALAAGQLSPAQVDLIRRDPNPANRVLEILCQPGFSTAERVTDLSGRGVGLDVVYTQVRDLGGVLRVTSELGKGTTFSLQIRGALLNARLLVCQGGDRVYAFVSDEIAQVTIPTLAQVKLLGTQRVLRWQERSDREPVSVPLYSLQDLLPYRRALPDRTNEWDIANERINNLLAADRTAAPVLLLRDPQLGGFVGIEVSAIVEEQELAIKPLTDAIAPPPYVYGCTTLADGRLSLVIDGLSLLDCADKQPGSSLSSLPARAPAVAAISPAQGTTANPLAADATNPYGKFGSGMAPAAPVGPEPIPPSPPSGPTAGKTLLIVDDSVTERRTLSAILQKGGFRVLQAQDGRDALEILQGGQHHIDLVVSDLEMPNLNGLEFLGLKNQHPELADIPAIVLTSRTRDKYQRIALGLGASAYLTKPYLDRELLDAIEGALDPSRRP